MLHRAYRRLSSYWSYFSEERERLKLSFSLFKYPDELVPSSNVLFMNKNCEQQELTMAKEPEHTVRIVLLFKDQ